MFSPIKEPPAMVKKVILGAVAVIAVVVIGLAIAIAMQPTDYHIERSLAMNAPPEAVFAQVNDFHNWDAWSPWLKVDPNAKATYEGPPSGEGAVFRWAGNDEVGEGSMTILESQPHELIRIKLAFVKPFEDQAATDFHFQPQGNQTKVTWTMDGKNNFVGKAMCLFVFDMDEMIGSKYDEGLASMKKIVEAPSEPPEPGPAEPAIPTETAPAETPPEE
jgi:hypothetical protein